MNARLGSVTSTLPSDHATVGLHNSRKHQLRDFNNCLKAAGQRTHARLWSVSKEWRALSSDATSSAHRARQWPHIRQSRLCCLGAATSRNAVLQGPSRAVHSPGCQLCPLSSNRGRQAGLHHAASGMPQRKRLGLMWWTGAATLWRLMCLKTREAAAPGT